MAKGFLRTPVGQGVSISRITDHRFKTNRVSINFILPLSQETAAANALVPYLLRKGSADYPDFQTLNKRLGELYGAFLDVDVRKLGGLQVLGVSIRTIDNRYALDGEDLLFQCTKLLCDLVTKPLLKDGLFVQENFEVEKQVLIDEIKAKINDKRSYAVSRCEEELFAGSAAALDELGDLESAQALQNRDAVEAYHRILEQSQVEFMISGVSFSDAAADYLTKSFSAFKRNPELCAVGEIQPSPKERDVVEHMDVKQSKMVLGFSLEPEGDRDLAVFRMLTALYGGTPVSKLFANVREKLSLCYYCVSRFDRFKNVILVDCGVEQGNVQKAKEEIINQLEDVKKGSFSAEGVSAASMSLKNSFTSLTDSLGGLENWYLSQICSGTEYSPEEEAEKVEAVTAQEIAAAAGRLKLEITYLLTGTQEA